MSAAGRDVTALTRRGPARRGTASVPRGLSAAAPRLRSRRLAGVRGPSPRTPAPRPCLERLEAAKELRASAAVAFVAIYLGFVEDPGFRVGGLVAEVG